MEDHPPIYPRGRGRWRRAAIDSQFLAIVYCDQDPRIAEKREALQANRIQ